MKTHYNIHNAMEEHRNTRNFGVDRKWELSDLNLMAFTEQHKHIIGTVNCSIQYNSDVTVFIHLVSNLYAIIQ